MEMTGLSDSENRLVDRAIFEASRANEYHDLRQADILSQMEMERQFSKLLQALVDASASDDVHLIIAVEGAIVTADHIHFVKSVEGGKEKGLSGSKNAIRGVQEKAFTQMIDMYGKLALRGKNPNRYHLYMKASVRHDTRLDRSGLPKDGVREIISSHISRLRNKMSHSERNSQTSQEVLELRLKNFAKADRLYKKLQLEYEQKSNRKKD